MSSATTHIKTEKQLVPISRFKEFEDVWKTVTLFDVSENVSYGMNAAAIAFDGIHKYLRITDIDEESGTFKPRPLTSPEGEISDKFKLKKNDIVFARTGASVGKPYLYNEKDGDLYYAGFLIKFSIINGDSYFIYCLTKKEAYNKWVHVYSMRSGQPGLNAEEYKALRLTLPSLPEQQKIASFLSAVDEKIQQLTKKKALLEDYKKGVMQQLFSGQLRFKDEKGNPYPDWEEKRLGEIVEIMTDYVAAGSFESLRNNVTVYDELNHALYVRLTDLRHGLKHKSLKYVDKSSFEFLSKSNLYGGELLLANIGANVGDVYLMPFNIGYATIAPNMIVIRENINQFHSTYLFYHLNSHGGKKEINKAISGSGQPKLSKTDFKKVKLKLPSLGEQQKIATYLSSIDTKIEAVNNQITQTQTFKKGLLQQMFV